MQNFQDHKLQWIAFDILYFIKLNTVLKIQLCIFALKVIIYQWWIQRFTVHIAIYLQKYSTLSTNGIDLKKVPQNI